MPPSANRDNDPLARLQGTTHVVHAFNVGDDLLQRTVRLHALGKRPHRVSADDSLRDGRTIVHVRLNGQTKGTSANRQDERRQHASEQTATRRLSPTTRSGGRTQIRRIINTLSLNTTTHRRCGGDVTNGRKVRILKSTQR